MYKIIWDVQNNLGCTNYFGMYKIIWDVQIILGCTYYFGFVHLGCQMYKIIWDLPKVFLVASISWAMLRLFGKKSLHVRFQKFLNLTFWIHQKRYPLLQSSHMICTFGL